MNKLFIVILLTTLFSMILIFVYLKFLSKRSKIFVQLLIFPIILEILVSPLRGYVSMQSSMLVGFFSFFLLSYLLLNKYAEKVLPRTIFFILLLGLILLFAPSHIFNFEGTLISLPDACFHLLGIVGGYLFFKIHNGYRWIVLGSTSLLCFLMYFKGYDLWLNKLSYGTFTGQIEAETAPQQIILSDSFNNRIDLNNIQNRIIVLDFWNSKCGVCYEKFPKLQKLYDKYKMNEKIKIYAVNYFLKEYDKPGDAFRIIQSKGYRFPVLVCDDEVLKKVFKIDGFPVVIIINEDKKLVFRGDITGADSYLSKMLENK